MFDIFSKCDVVSAVRSTACIDGCILKSNTDAMDRLALVVNGLPGFTELLPLHVSGSGNLPVTFQNQLCNVNYVIAIGLVQALFASALLWRMGFARKGDTILLALMICIAAHMAIKFSIYTVVADDAVRSQMNTCIGFCYGPLLLLYRDQLNGGGSHAMRRWYLFLPFALALVGYLTVISVLTVSVDIGHLVLKRYNTTTWILLPVLNAVCAIECLRRPAVRTGRPGHNLTNRLAILLLIGSTVPIAISLLYLLYPGMPAIPIRSIAYLIIAAMPLTIIWDLAAAKLPSAQIPGSDQASHVVPTIAVSEKASIGNNDKPVEGLTVKAQTNSDPEMERALLSRVEDHLRDPDVLSNPGLSLESLAKGVGASRHQLSEMLNGFAGQSFYDFLNARRIQQTTRKMADLSSKGIPVNILILAFDNGFKAKSSFNAAFRKFTGMTPSAYLEELRDSGGSVLTDAAAQEIEA